MTLFVLIVAPAALAGNVTVVTFSEVPADFEAGTPYHLQYSILAHGVEPVDVGASSLRFTGPDGETLSFPATSAGEGQWTAEVTLTSSGEWRWEVVAGDQVLQPLDTLQVLPAPAPAPTGPMTTLRIALPIATLLALALLVGQIRNRPRVERRPSAATDAV
jgi:hypothetical protein